MHSDAPFDLHPDLDLAAAAAGFRAAGRVRVPSFLSAESADRLHAHLARDVPWRLCFNDGASVQVLPPDRVAATDRAGQQALMAGIMARARDRFQFLYNSYPMLTAYQRGEDPHLLLHRLLEWINTPLVLDAVRRITGIPGLVKADAQATLYRPGHFLTLHNDAGDAAEHRRVAYVLNLTRDWKADWGGLLQFLDADGAVTESWVPGFNVLALFRVPVLHAVSYVTPFAGAPRFAITGWFRDG